MYRRQNNGREVSRVQTHQGFQFHLVLWSQRLSVLQLRFVIASLTCPARQSIRILSRTVKHLRTVHVQLFPCRTDGLHCRMVAAKSRHLTRSNGWVGGPRKTVSTMNKTYVFGKTSVL